MDYVTRNFCYALYVVCFVFLDQITKSFMENRDFFVGPLHLHSVQNTGLSFGLNFGPVINIAVLTLAALMFLWSGSRSNYNRYGLMLILAGAFSNVLDRFILGYVRDFADLDLFTANLADLYILIGLGIVLFLSSNKDGLEPLNN